MRRGLAKLKSGLTKRSFAASNAAANENGVLLDKILIANRGEIAVRVMKTAKRLGVKCVAVFSDADQNAMHTQLADEACRIGPPPSTDSYLRADKIIEVMKQTGAKAVHPGYGFLSENYKFAERLEKEGLVFIGPPASAIRSMGSKSESKRIMEKAGVSCVPGYHEANQEPHFLKAKAAEIGYPVMIKAVLGGGGKGMRIAKSEDDFLEMLASAKSEAAKSFGDDQVILEKYIERSRHIEVQVFADKHGNYVYLFERDCSVQRRHQKVLEEAPAPNITQDLKVQLGESAVAAAKAVNYVGAGTVEFIFDCSDQKFYFMEMNTRLQVEHPVTEMITGLDLVEWQLKIASGMPLPLKQKDIQQQGHAVEARIYAENPQNSFMPDTGRLAFFSGAEKDPDVRLETGVKQGDEISVFYDPMIAKVIAKGNTRAEAVRKLSSALCDLKIAGPRTNIPFVLQILGHGEFASGNFDTSFISEHGKSIFDALERTEADGIIAAALVAHFQQSAPVLNDFRSFHLGSSAAISIRMRDGRKEYALAIKSIGDAWRVQLDGKDRHLRIVNQAKNQMTLLIEGRLQCVSYYFENNRVYIWMKNGHHISLDVVDGLAVAGGQNEDLVDDTRIKVPMPCKIAKLHVKAGDMVERGAIVAVTEAMKMEQSLRAAKKGRVARVNCVEGDVVSEGVVIVEFEGS